MQGNSQGVPPPEGVEIAYDSTRPAEHERTSRPGDVPGDVTACPMGPAPPSGLSAGAVIGAYRVERSMARGGFGQVYEAYDLCRGRWVALKVLHAELALRTEAVARFEREVRLLGRLRHPNTVEVLDVGVLPDGRPFFAMERLFGETLAARVRRRGRLGLDDTLAVAEPVCAVLGAAHARGVVHRDVKPSNVFLADRVVLIDFGVAMLLDDTGPRLTTTRHIVGSPVSIAPEQLRGDPIDGRADVYGLGVLLFHALSGRFPFVHTDLAVLQEMHLHQAPPRLSELAPVPVEVETVVLRALAKDPALRPDDPTVLWQELAAARGHPGASGGEGVAVLAELHVPPFGDVGIETLDRIEDVLPTLVQRFSEQGFSVDSMAGDSALLIGPGSCARIAVLADLARELLKELTVPPAELSITLHAGPRAALGHIAHWLPPVRRGVTVG